MTWNLAQDNLFRNVFLVASILIGSALIGCGGSSTTAVSSPSPSSSQIAQDNTPQPTDIVSQFLDQVRRGGDNTAAGDLLTQAAQMELKRIGRSVQPIGTPNASFKVTRGEAHPDDPNAMIVHSIWSEPNEEGGQSDSEVLWGLKREPNGWRISGLAVEPEPGVDLVVVNFEDGNSMLQMLGGAETSQPGADMPSQAAIPAQSTTR
jgi:hypothetical protein